MSFLLPKEFQDFFWSFVCFTEFLEVFKVFFGRLFGSFCQHRSFFYRLSDWLQILLEKFLVFLSKNIFHFIIRIPMWLVLHVCLTVDDLHVAFVVFRIDTRTDVRKIPVVLDTIQPQRLLMPIGYFLTVECRLRHAREPHIAYHDACFLVTLPCRSFLNQFLRVINSTARNHIHRSIVRFFLLLLQKNLPVFKDKDFWTNTIVLSVLMENQLWNRSLRFPFQRMIRILYFTIQVKLRFRKIHIWIWFCRFSNCRFWLMWFQTHSIHHRAFIFNIESIFFVDINREFVLFVYCKTIRFKIARCNIKELLR